MWSRRLDVAVALMLMMVLVAAALSGLLADYLGIPRSLYHRLSAYALVVAASWHILLRHRQLWARLKAIRGRRRRSLAPPEATGGRLSRRAKRLMLSRRRFLLSAATAVAAFFLGRWVPLRREPSELGEVDLGLAYHRWSMPSLAGIVRRPFQWGGWPGLYKDYPLAERTALPRDIGHRGLTVAEAIERRRSVRDYSRKVLALDQLSALLHSASGITEPSHPFRATPSAGALYPLEVPGPGLSVRPPGSRAPGRERLPRRYLTGARPVRHRRLL